MAKTSNYSFSTVFGLAGRPEMRYRFHPRASATVFALMFTKEVAQEYRKKPNFKERFHGANSHVVRPHITYGVQGTGILIYAKEIDYQVPSTKYTVPLSRFNGSSPYAADDSLWRRGQALAVGD